MLIATKLRPPRVAQDLLLRPRLYATLDHGRSGKLTLICAPAGYGKSSLAAAWLASSGHAHIWISLDPSDSDLGQFLSYLAQSLKEAAPHAGTRLSNSLQGATLPPTDFIAANLINDLDEIETPFIIVLDDFHFIENAETLQLTTSLLQYLPHQIHVVMITRKDPALPLVQMRARQELVEIRMEQLRFTEAEGEKFLQHALGAQSSTVSAARLTSKTEGWPVGLRLATLAIQRAARQSAPAAPTDAADAAGNGLVMNYLIAEVLAKAEPSMRAFMLRTSLCERLCAGLCRALLDEVDPVQSVESRVDALKRTNLFVVELDEGGEWWRYHHLFQQLLQHQLADAYSEAEIHDLHRRAGRWHAEHGFLDEAFAHALAAQDLDTAVSLLEQNRFAMMNQDRWHVLVRWLAQLPDEVKRTRPDLILAQAWVAYYQHRMTAIPGLLASLEEHGEGHPDQELLRTEVTYFRGLELFWRGASAESYALLDDVVGRLSAVSDQAGSEANLQRVLTLQMMGQCDAARQSLYHDLYGPTPPSPVRKTRLLAALAFSQLLAGELDAMLETADQGLELARAGNNAYVEAWMQYLCALCYFARNELAAARECFEHAVAQRYVLHTMAAVDSLAGLAITQAAQGDSARAEAALALLQEFAASTGDLHYVTIARTAQVRVLLLQGQTDAAAQRLQTADLSSETGVLFFFLEIPRLTACRVAVGRPDGSGLRQCVAKLDELRAAVAAQHNIRQLIEIDALRAVAHGRLGHATEAQDALNHALTLAAPGRWIRPFVELGPVMAELLRGLGPRHPQRAFVAHLLAQFPTDTARPVPTPAAPMVDPLTRRELEVLQLLAARLTNQEIASRLVVSPATVKRHTANIYQKLHVNSRRRAVAKARVTGQLPPA